MVCKVRLVHEVTCFIKGDSEEDIQEFINCHTPEEIVKGSKAKGVYVEEDYNEEIICNVMDNSDYDFTTSEGLVYICNVMDNSDYDFTTSEGLV